MSIPTPPGLEGLVDLACRDGVDIRPTLLRVLTDLYVQKPSHTAEEERHYVELAQRLIETVDARTRAAVTARLMSYRQVPEALRHHLELHAILPEPATDDPAAAADLMIGQPAVDAPRLLPDITATPRATVTAAELCDIFFDAGPDERRLILMHLDAVAGPAATPPTNAELAIRHLEAAALRHDGGAFARELVGTFGIAREHARRIVDDQTGETILVAAKVLAMPAAVLQRILLFLNPSVGQSVQRVYDLAALYEHISIPAAQHIMSIMRRAAPPAHPAYQSVLYQSAFWNDEQVSARDAATPRPRSVQDRDTDAGFSSLPPPFRIGAR